MRFLRSHGLASSADPREGLQDLWILGLETAVHGYIFRRVFAEEDQRVAYMVGIVDRRGYFLDHLFLRFRFKPGGASMNTTGIEFLLSLIHDPYSVSPRRLYLLVQSPPSEPLPFIHSRVGGNALAVMYRLVLVEKRLTKIKYRSKTTQFADFSKSWVYTCTA